MVGDQSQWNVLPNFTKKRIEPYRAGDPCIDIGKIPVLFLRTDEIWRTHHPHSISVSLQIVSHVLPQHATGGHGGRLGRRRRRREQLVVDDRHGDSVLSKFGSGPCILTDHRTEIGRFFADFPAIFAGWIGFYRVSRSDWWGGFQAIIPNFFSAHGMHFSFQNLRTFTLSRYIRHSGHSRVTHTASIVKYGGYSFVRDHSMVLQRPPNSTDWDIRCTAAFCPYRINRQCYERLKIGLVRYTVASTVRRFLSNGDTS